MMSPIVYLNGDFLPESNAFIPVTDRGFLFGDGIFTTLKVNEGHPEFLEQHLQRLEQQCSQLAIVAQKFSTEIIHELIIKNHAQQGAWKLKIIVSGGADGFDVEKRAPGQLLITLKPYLAQASPCRLTSYPHPICHPLAKVKSLSYLDRLWIADYALKHGFDDVLVRDHHGIVLETAFANLFWRVGENLFFPDSSLPLMQGVTLQVLLVAAGNVGLHLHPIQAKLQDIPPEAQLYLCNSLKGIVPVIAIDSKKINRDEAFENTLQEIYTESLCFVD